MSIFHPFPAASIEDLAFLRMQAFHDQRVSAIADGKTFLKNTSGGILVVHLIPKRCVLEHLRFEGNVLQEAGIKIPPLDGHSSGTRFNADGFLNFSGHQEPQSYSMVFRDGRLETIMSDVFYEQAQGQVKQRLLRDMICEEAVCKTARRYQRIIEELTPQPETWMFSSLLDCLGMRVGNDFPYRDHNAGGIDSSRCTLPELLLPTDEDGVNAALHGWCDTLWQACGKERSFNFTEEGIWQPRR